MNDMDSPRILSIFNRYLQYGGEEAMAAKMAELLSHKFTVSEFLYSTEEWLKAGKGKALVSGLHHEGIVKSLRTLQQEHRFDYWLIHNVFPAMSPAVYREAVRQRVKIIHILHNYRFSCLNGTFFRNGQECRKCNIHHISPGLIHRCWKNSFAQTCFSALFQKSSLYSGIFNPETQFIALSSQHAQLLIEAGFPEQYLSILPLFVDTFQKPYTPPPADGDILFMGRLTPEKGLLSVLQAWEKLRPNRRLVIAGDGPDRQELENWTRQHHLTDVVFLGFVPPDQQDSLWESATAFISPSLWHEPGATVILEALGRGRPVIAFAKGAACDHLADSRHGWLMSPNDKEALVKTLQKVFQTTAEELNVMGLQSRHFVAENRSPTSWLHHFSEILKR